MTMDDGLHIKSELSYCRMRTSEDTAKLTSGWQMSCIPFFFFGRYEHSDCTILLSVRLDMCFQCEGLQNAMPPVRAAYD